MGEDGRCWGWGLKGDWNAVCLVLSMVVWLIVSISFFQSLAYIIHSFSYTILFYNYLLSFTLVVYLNSTFVLIAQCSSNILV